MELKQLDYFVQAADCGSTSKAAELLYTSQPNVSKVIQALEKELGCALFFRTNRGVNLTPQGENLYEYAKNILKNASIMTAIAGNSPFEKFSVSCYPSHMISRIFCEHYNKVSKNNLSMEFLEGTLEEVARNVEENRSELGIVYYSRGQKSYVNHILSHKNLEFEELANKSVCIYAGRFNPLFQRESVSFAELSDHRFVQSSRDFFSMEHQLEDISKGAFSEDQFQIAVNTNSDNLLLDMLQHTSLCNMGIHFMIPDYQQYGIRAVLLEDCDECLTLGFLKRKEGILSEHGEEFLCQLKEILTLS